MKASFIEKPARSGRYYPLVELSNGRKLIVGDYDSDKRRATKDAADVIVAAKNGDVVALRLLWFYY